VPTSILTIADAVTTELNSASFKAELAAASLDNGYTAVRTNDTLRTLEEVDSLSVIVMAASQDDANAARVHYRVDHEIHIGVRDKCDTTDDAATDLLIQLCEYIKRRFRQFSSGSFTCLSATYPVLYRPEDFAEKNQFTGVVRLRFQGVE
jgi:hypothetical protein